MSSPKILLGLFFLLLACESGPALYEPQGLQKLSPTETLQRFKRGQFIGENTVIKDSLGNELDYNTFVSMNDSRFFADQYANEEGEVMELVVRGFRPSDQPLLDSLSQLMQSRNTQFMPVPVNCESARDTLEWIYERDQGMRDGSIPFDARIDRTNQEIIASLLDKCGFPKREMVGDKAMDAIFLVVQHGEAALRTQLFPVLSAAAQLGEFSSVQMALMEDRVKMDRGLPQKYGSQLVKEPHSGEWMLYPVEEMERIDVLRDSVGLEPLGLYLERFGLSVE